jgi:site-specific DNA recombinase
MARQLSTTVGRTQGRGARAIGYVRVSRVGARGGESFISPPVQRNSIEAKARERGLEVVEWQTDLDASGGKFEREGFQRALEAVEAGEAEAIIVAKLTRFARSVLDTHRALNRIESVGGRLIACDLDVDVSTPAGRMMRNILATLAEFELDVAREGWETAKAFAVERGVKIASRAPFGYRFDATHRLEPVDGERELVVELFERRADDASWGELLELFEARTGRVSYKRTIKHMIENRAYTGAVTYSDHLVNESAHEAIVSRELFEAARLTGVRRAGGPRQGRGVQSLLGGIAKCATCGHGLSRSSGGVARPAGLYRCPNHRCGARASILQADLDAYVEAELFAWAGEVVDEEIAVALEPEAPARSPRAEVERRLRDARRGLELYVTAPDGFGLEPALFAAGARARERLIDELEVELAELGEEDEIEAIRTTLRDVWRELPDERRRLVSSVVDAVMVERRDRSAPKPIGERARVIFGASPATDDRAELPD